MVVQPPEPITCRHCGKDSGYTNKGLMHFVIPDEGLTCQHCGEVFLKPNRPMLAARCSPVSDRVTLRDGDPGAFIDVEFDAGISRQYPIRLWTGGKYISFNRGEAIHLMELLMNKFPLDALAVDEVDP